MPERKRVLILDDSSIVLELVGEALEAAGIEPLTAPDLAHLERRLAERPDLLVIDVNMPEAYGDDVGAVLRDVRGMKVPIVLFSSLKEADLAARAVEQGFADYVSKDAGVDALVQKVRMILGT
jgi:two-component system KDP operon response regulator KdpE